MTFYLVEPMPRFYNLPKWRVFAVREGKYTPKGQFWEKEQAEGEAHRRNRLTLFGRRRKRNP